MVRKLPQLLFVASVLFFAGCTPFRKVVLFQKNADNKAPDSLYANQTYEFVIAPSDLLQVRVVSTVDEVAESLEVFNPAAAAGTANAALGPNAYLTGTLVDKDGNIELPYVGNIPVAGLTLAQAADTIRSRLSSYILDVDRNLLVTLKILNFNVNVLGEVVRQGTVQAENEYLTVTEVLAKAGGITDFGNRQNVKLIRTDRLTKKTTSYRIDLTTEDVVTPQLARLQPNDVLYVQPLRRKQLSSASQLLGLITGIISVPLLIISIYNVVQTINSRNGN
jgi:polysaccharide export outer membrane protein